MSSTENDTLGGISVDDLAGEPKRRRPGRPAGSKNRPGPKATLEHDLRQAHLGLSMAVVGVTNPQVLGVKQAVDILDEQAGKWAAQAYAVARQDERVMNSLLWAMQSGAWIGTFTFPVMLLQPKLASMMVPQQPTPAPPAAETNGNGNGAEIA